MDAVRARWYRRHRALTCRRAVELVTDYLEGVLSEPMRLRLEGHLAGCPPCAAYLRQVRVAIDLAAHVDPDALEPEVVDALVAWYRHVTSG